MKAKGLPAHGADCSRRVMPVCRPPRAPVVWSVDDCGSLSAWRAPCGCRCPFASCCSFFLAMSPLSFLLLLSAARPLSLAGSRRRTARLRHLFDHFGGLAFRGVLGDVRERDDAAASAARIHNRHAPDLVLFQDATALCERR